MTSLTPLLAFLGFFQDAAPAQHAAGGEAALVLPDLAKALFLGGINGLPSLPAAYLGTGTIDGDPPIIGETITEKKLRDAFGEDCEEAKRKIRLELGARGMVLAAQDFHILTEGNAPSRKVKLALTLTTSPGGPQRC